MPGGKYLGTDAAAVGEMMVFLYSFAHDYSGAYLCCFRNGLLRI
jgi:hypothetical protein